MSAKLKKYVDTLYNWQNPIFENYVKYLLKLPYGNIVSSISLLSVKYVSLCIKNFKDVDEKDYKKLSTFQKIIVDNIKKFRISKWSVVPSIMSIDFAKKLYEEYSRHTMNQLAISLDFGMNDLTYSKFLNKETSIVKNVDSIQNIYYYCFYAMIVYEKNNIINEMLPKPEDISSLSPENYIYHFNYDVYMEKRNLFQPKFFIYLDHLGLNIIIAIKGLTTTADTISFIVGDLEYPYCLNRFSKETDYLAHKGFTAAACNVLETIDPILKKWVSMYPDYNIKVVGHSYGAGVASIVAWALNEDVETGLLQTNASVRGILFGCPPVFNQEAVTDTCKFLVNIVFGWDLIPCFSASNFYKFSCGLVSETLKKEKCYNPFSSEDKTIFCETYVPGTIYWLVYDEATKEAHSLNLIFKDNDRLQNIILHERMDNDQDIKLTFVYLLALINKL